MRSTSLRQKSGCTVSQMCWIAPGPAMSAIVKVLLPGRWTLGDTFQPWPSSRAATAPVPSVAMPACPLAPVKFSALIERVTALDSLDRLPRLMSSPLKVRFMGSSAMLRGKVEDEVKTALSAQPQP